MSVARGNFCSRHHLDLSSSLDAVLVDPTIKAVLLATPHSLHPAQVIACAKAQKQVFCEKPVALHRADAAKMFDACREAGVLLAVGHNRRFWPSLRTLRDIVAGGELGTLLHIEGHNSNENSQSITAGWRLSEAESPGGGLTGAGLHVLDTFVSMLGPVRQISAQLHSSRGGPAAAGHRHADDGFCHGVTGTLSTIRATPFFWRVHVFGTKGSAEVLDETTLIRRVSGSKPMRHTFPTTDVLRAELDAFADAVEGKRPYPVPEAEVLATLAAFEAALASMKSGNPVRCDGH